MRYFDWIAKAEGEMNGNAFKFGSKTTQKSAIVKRTADYSISFDLKSKGFDNNNIEQCTGILLIVLPSITILTINYLILLKNGQITEVGTQ